MKTILASLAKSLLSRPKSSMREPTRCPYHPDLPCHWTKCGSYWRSDPSSPADNPEKIPVQRYQCELLPNTFSISPDALPPYQRRTNETILRCLTAMIVDGRGTSKTAQIFSVPCTMVRRIRTKFLDVVKVLRLPGCAGALDAAAFLRRLFALGIDAIVELFARWKELEPKYSLVGIYPR